jgi:Fe2+ transport system protein FeoA
MPLSMVKPGQNVILKEITWGENVKKRLEDMGLTQGVQFTLINGNPQGAQIIDLRGSRLILGRGMSNKIMVDLC